MEDKPENGQAGVEVTPEMIDAGLLVLAGYSEWEQAREIVAKIFVVMDRERETHSAP